MKPRTLRRICLCLVGTTFLLVSGFALGHLVGQRSAGLKPPLLVHTEPTFKPDDDLTPHELMYMHESFSGDAVHEREYSEEIVWLYSLITTDYEGHSMVPHFMRHYKKLGVPHERFYVDLLHDPSLPDTGLVQAQKLFATAGAHYRIIYHPYTPDLQDQAMVSALSKIPMHAEDWVMVPDMDEFFTFDENQTVNDVVTAMNSETATYAMGEMLDHVALGGELISVDNFTSIWDQFPLICPVTATVAKGLPAKVSVFKAYLRTGAGHHHIVEPYLAHAYFSSQCAGVQCELVMKRYRQRTLRDLYAFTPYARFAGKYDLTGSLNSSGWRAKEWSSWSKVHHFKWHAGVLDNLLFRMARDSGNCLLGINDTHCTPIFQFWKEVARQFQTLNATQNINITGLGCQDGSRASWKSL